MWVSFGFNSDSQPVIVKFANVSVPYVGELRIQSDTDRATADMLCRFSTLCG